MRKKRSTFQFGGSSLGKDPCQASVAGTGRPWKVLGMGGGGGGGVVPDQQGFQEVYLFPWLSRRLLRNFSCMEE